MHTNRPRDLKGSIQVSVHNKTKMVFDLAVGYTYEK
jgi:hypothetical protein